MGRVQGDDQHCTTGGELQTRSEEKALGEKEVERQLHVPCLKSFEL